MFFQPNRSYSWNEFLEAKMTHTRIRKFNTRDTYPEQQLDNDLCQAVRAGSGTSSW